MSGVTVYLFRETAQRDRAGLLLEAAANYTGMDTAGWHRVNASGGKPFFEEAPELSFSISHSGEYWACAFGSAPLGFDLQQHQPGRFQRLSRRFFHPEEDAWLCAHDYGEAEFFRIWTAKESWLKRTGEGLSAGLDSFSVLSPLPDGSVLQYLTAPEHYTMCLCTAQSESAEIIRIDHIL